MKVSTFIREKYWPAFQEDLSPAWQRRTGDFLTIMCRDLGEYEMDGLRPDIVDPWWGKLRRQFETPVTPNKVLTRAKHIWKTAIRWGDAVGNPFEGLKRKKEAEHKFTFLSEVEQEALLSHCGENLRHYQVFAKYTGARLSSIWKVEERDINLEKQQIRFRRTKNGEDYTVPLHSELKLYLIEHHLLLGDPARRLLYQYTKPGHISRMFCRLKKKQGIEFRFHDYRHSVGAKLGSKFKNGKIVQDMLGHKDPRMSLRYTHIDPEALQKAAEEAL